MGRKSYIYIFIYTYMRCMRLSKCNNNVRPLINAEAGVRERVRGGAEEGREIETKSERIYSIYIISMLVCASKGHKRKRRWAFCAMG